MAYESEIGGKYEQVSAALAMNQLGFASTGVGRLDEVLF